MVKLEICWNAAWLPSEREQELEPQCDLVHERKHQLKKYEGSTKILLGQNISRTDPGLTTKFLISST